MDTSNTPDHHGKKPSYFIDIWGRKETRCSALIAQTIVLSIDFRTFIAKKLDIPNRTLIIEKIKTEHSFENGHGRIDIYLKTANGLIIGIENKKWHYTRDEQLRGYTEALKTESDNYRLVFLSPSWYKISNDSLAIATWIKYKDIMRWIQDWEFGTEFEKQYFEYLLQYFRELDVEVEPITTSDLVSLKNQNKIIDISTTNKLKAILTRLQQFPNASEQRTSTGHIYYSIKFKDITVYVGYRYLKLKFYKDELLNGEPECLIYIYDDWDGSQKEEKNQIVINIYSHLKNQNTDVTTHLNHYQIMSHSECRFSIRKSLTEFCDKDPDDIVNWFLHNINLLQKAIEENVHE